MRSKAGTDFRSTKARQARNPTSLEATSAAIISILRDTQWRDESNEAAQDLFQVVRDVTLYSDFNSHNHDPQKVTEAMYVAWQCVREASSTDYGEDAIGCTRVLTACREKLLLSMPELDPSGWRSALRSKPLPLPSTLRDDESQQQSSDGRVEDVVVSRYPTSLLPLGYNSDSKGEQQSVRPSLGASAVPISSTEATAGPITSRVRQQGAVTRAPVMRHKPLPPILRDDESRQRWPSPTAERAVEPTGPHQTLLGVNRRPSEESLAVSRQMDRRQAIFAASDEEGSVVSVSSSVASSNSVADVGAHIAWISSTPVKVNGHFCDIFAGLDSRVGKVALKRPRIGAAGKNKDIIRSFQREAETWARLQHPHILEYLGTFQRDGYFYLVSPFIENGTLAQYITLNLRVNRVKLMCETANAIAYMHKQGVVHGNIKASNLLIGDDGEVLLCDFGLTRTTDLKTPTETKGAGAIRWQSPELLNGHSKSFKSDVYAFGMTIVEVLTGSVPFPDLETDGAVISTVLIEGKRPPKNPTESSAGLSYENVWAVAEACWPALPEERISMTKALQLIQADPALCDIGSFITSISRDAVRVNGHFCDVFEGMHLTAGRVALKRPRIGGIGDEEATIRRFEREAMTWRSLRHPHILQFLGTFRRDRHLYLVSPFINNGTLVEYIARNPETNRVRLLCETADALKYLHLDGVVHGDIKGGNILIDDNIHCLLCDFGLTKVTHSRTSTVMKGAGTFRWQSPELWFDAPKSFSSDAYAFSMTIVEVLTGEAPFAHLNNDTAVMFAVVNNGERPPKVPTKSLSRVSYLGAWDVAEACWSQNPEERISMSVAFQRLQADPSSS